MLNRRSFLRTTLATTAAFSTGQAFAALAANNTYRENIGIQLYTLRNQIGKDVDGTLKSVAEAGFKQVELYGFPSAEKMIRAAKTAGLAINSSHFNWDSAVNPKDEAMTEFSKILDAAKQTGLTHLVVPSLQLGNRNSPDAWKKTAENLNKAAAKAKAAGIQLAYHNHAFEFQPMADGKTGYDIFTAEFSSDMKFEIDVFWVKVAGIEPVELITKLSGRVSQLHLKDLKKDIKTPHFGGLPGDAYKELGNGQIAFGPVLEAAKKAGVVHCHVEQDSSPDPLASIRQSIAHLKTL